MSNFEVRITQWHGVANWTWNVGDEVCGICRASYDDCDPEAKFPGDHSSVVWGVCDHAFHTWCIMKWLSDHSGTAGHDRRCPLCRQPWEFKINEVAATPNQNNS